MPKAERPETPSYATARRPDRRRRVAANGVRIAVYEWGDPEAPPLLMAHGGLDFAATYDLLAPRLADAGWRVIAWDQRGHCDSDHPELYSWEADLRDLLAVFDSVSPAPIPAVGHSKGANLLMQFADAMPHRVERLVNLDGFPGDRPPTDVVNHYDTQLEAEMEKWLDWRRQVHLSERRPGTLDELARRRQPMNPRLRFSWLRYIAAIGARQDEDGWRWKLDPAVRFGGFGPFKPQWLRSRMPGLEVPLLGIMGDTTEPMGWLSTPESVTRILPIGAHLEVLNDTGHFVHIERPDDVAAMILDFAGRP